MKKLLATLVAMALALTICASTVLAATNSVTYSSNVMTFVTQLNMSSTAITAPEVTFDYEIYDAPSAVFITGDDSFTQIYNGVGASEIVIGSAAFSTSDILAQDNDATNNYFTKDVTVNFSDVTFTATGIYHYQILAQITDVDGITMDSNYFRHVYVYVIEGDSAGDYVISTIIMTETELASTDTYTGEDGVKYAYAAKSTGYTNAYAAGVTTDPETNPTPTPIPTTIPGATPTPVATPEPPTADASPTPIPTAAPSTAPGFDAYQDFVVTFETAGNMADSSKDFTFALTDTDGATVEGIDDGTIFAVSYNNATVYMQYTTNDGFQIGTLTGTEFSADADATAAFLLSNGEGFTILSVVAGMTFEVTATAVDNYDVSYKTYEVEDPDDDWVDGLVFSNAVDEETADDEGISFKGYYAQLIPETGVILQILPFALMVLVAGGFIAIRFVKLGKANDEE